MSVENYYDEPFSDESAWSESEPEIPELPISTVALEVTRHSSHCHVKLNVTPVVVASSQTSLQWLSRQVKRHSSGCHVHGLVTKCDRFITALRFIHLQYTDPRNSARVAEIETLTTRITSWKKSYGKRKAERRALTL